MKEPSSVQVALFSETFGKFVSEMSLSLHAYRRENFALRELLLEQGLTRRQIQREVRKRMKPYRIYEEALLLSRTVCQRILEMIRANDPLESVVENLSKVGKRNAN